MSTENAPSVDVLKTQATDAVRKVSDTIHDQANVLRDTAAGVRYDTQNFIENNPWLSVALAASIGFVIGVAVAKR